MPFLHNGSIEGTVADITQLESFSNGNFVCGNDQKIEEVGQVLYFLVTCESCSYL